MRLSSKTVLTLQQQKGNTPIVCLTAYTAPMAKLIDPYVDIILVGDSLGMVLYGMDTTLGVSIDMMIAHGRAVVSASKNAFVVVDMPFGSYQSSPEEAFKNAAKIISETGCNAVKLEGGSALADTVSFITKRGIPVVGHIGLMPQYIHSLGGFRYQGRTNESATHLIADARHIEEAGAFAIVLEGIKERVAYSITHELRIPTIGIGASPLCDGQVLVLEDILGIFSDFTPKFVKRYLEASSLITEAVHTYATEVRNRTFPAIEHCFDSEERGGPV